MAEGHFKRLRGTRLQLPPSGEINEPRHKVGFRDSFDGSRSSRRLWWWGQWWPFYCADRPRVPATPALQGRLRARILIQTRPSRSPIFRSVPAFHRSLEREYQVSKRSSAGIAMATDYRFRNSRRRVHFLRSPWIRKTKSSYSDSLVLKAVKLTMNRLQSRYADSPSAPRPTPMSSRFPAQVQSTPGYADLVDAIKASAESGSYPARDVKVKAAVRTVVDCIVGTKSGKSTGGAS